MPPATPPGLPTYPAWVTSAAEPGRTPLDREAARVLLLDGSDRLLLFRGCDPADRDRGQWWFTPGGGLDPGETYEQGARREVLEETGLSQFDLGACCVLRVA